MARSFSPWGSDEADAMPSDVVDREAAAYEPPCNCCGDAPRKRPRGLQPSLAQEYHWTGNCCMDYVFFVRNWHPFLGIFCSHPAHPYSKLERIAILFVVCCLSILPAELIELGFERAEDEGFFGFGASIGKRVAVLVFVTLPVTILSTALYWCLVLDDLCCSFLRTCVQRGAQCCLGFALCASVAILVLSLLLAQALNVDLEAVAHTSLKSQIQSWVVWFPVWTFLPCVGFLHVWCTERKAHEFEDDDEDSEYWSD